MNQQFWKNKKVLVTGHTGFKGSWLSIWLKEMGADVTGYAMNPYSDEDNYVISGVANRIKDIRGDIRDREHLIRVFAEVQPEIVFHLAAQPLVIDSYADPYYTYDVNVMGTMSVLEAIRKTQSVRAAVMITTDKCYENKETMTGYKETDSFGGYDPYSSSKACDEILISSYRNSFFPDDKYCEHHKAIASVRAGNVIGGGDWAANRILPDTIRAIEKNEPVQIRNRYAVRPWQHVLEPLSGYITVAERLYNDGSKYAEGWNFGPDENSIWTVWDVASCVVESYGKGSLVEVNKSNAVHEAGKLMLNIDKARTILGWSPKLGVKEAVEWTVEWYRERFSMDCYDICSKQIRRYMEL